MHIGPAARRDQLFGVVWSLEFFQLTPGPSLQAERGEEIFSTS